LAAANGSIRDYAIPEEPYMTTQVQADEQPLWQLAVVEGVFLVIAAIIIYLRHAVGALSFPLPLLTEVAIGLPVGGALGALVGAGLLRSPLREAVVRGVTPLRPVMKATWSIVLVGLMAGVGEELLFRAALLPWIGLWWAAVLFGIAHSGTAQLQDGISVGKVAYLVIAVAAGVLLGLLYGSAGLASSMSAHAAFDTGILLALAPAIAAGGSSEGAGRELTRP
jgi:membrane protease YdiL (CAAX protease family)